MADIVIGGRLHSAATGNTVAGANEIMDDAQGKKQSVVNQELANRISVAGQQQQAAIEAEAEARAAKDRELKALIDQGIIEGGGIVFDLEPTPESVNPVTSNGIAGTLGYNTENVEFVRVLVDSQNRVVFGIQRDGNVYFGAGVPRQIQEYVRDMMANIDLSDITTTLEQITDYLTGKLGTQLTLSEELDGKVDKEEGKSLIDADVAESFSTANNPEFVKAVTDSEGKLVAGIKKDGKVWLNDLEVDGKAFYGVTDSPEWLKVVLDSEGKVIAGIRKDGSTYIADLDAGDAIASMLAEFEERMAEIEDDIDAKMALFDAVFSEFTDPEGRIHITTDADGKILSYRDKEGVLHETNLAVEKKLELSDEAMTDFQQALKAAGFKPGGGGDFSDAITKKGKNPVYIPTPRCAMLNILSDINLITLSKSDRSDGVQKVNYDVKVQCEFFDGQGIYFKKWALIGAQGNSSMAFEKKNISIKWFDTENVENSKGKWGKGDTFGTVFGDWVMQKTYHLKAYHTDFLRGGAVVAYQIADEIYKTRGVYADRPWKKALINFDNILPQTPYGLTADGVDNMNLQIDNGARCMPDGFPVIVYQQGEFFGIFSWQLKKDADNMNMDTGNPLHIHIDGDLTVANIWDGSINWGGFEVRNPEDLVDMEGNDYDGDFPTELIDSTSSYWNPNNEAHVMSAQVKQAIINLSHRVGEINAMNATDSTAAKALFDTYFDADNLVDYQIINMVVGDSDGFSKNWQWTTWDGVKWYVNQYDKDMAFGNFWTGMFTSAPRTGWINSDTARPNGLAIRYYTPEIKARWQELVSAGIIDEEHIKGKITEWVNRIGKINYEREWAKWPEASCNRDSMIDFENWEFDNAFNDGVPSSGVWNENTNYSVGNTCWYTKDTNNKYLRFKAVKQNTNRPPLTGGYAKYPKSMGYRDSVWRFYKYVEQTITNQNNFINNL